MLYSIGYQKLRDEHELIAILVQHGIDTLVDVRSRPASKRAKFNRQNLEQVIPAAGLRYVWKGDVLGGFGHIADETIVRLAQWQQDKSACLMCMEADHRQCHRHLKIGKMLSRHCVEVVHLTAQSNNGQVGLFDEVGG